ncbi:unnamed protein product [Aureobasidium mustum]|uniref:AGC-kinase C-terminal domain-containing protein n=1 Tax=Aureobasidium mustum TaxID=2773714 RepID=A0A9N8K2N8_9PEZI|nr:unnamed protein product [Aureobasidium mustum]
MLEAAPPFRGEDQDMVFEEILDDDKPEYPPDMPESSKSILRQLLLREPDARLGADQTDAEAVMAHTFFAGIVWEDIACERTLPPRLSYHHEVKGQMTESSVSLGTGDDLGLFGNF